MRSLLAHCHLGLGKLYWRTDKREQAQEHLTTATTMYREMDIRFWLERAEAECPGLKASFTALPRKRQGSLGLSESLLDPVRHHERLPQLRDEKRMEEPQSPGLLVLHSLLL